MNEETVVKTMPLPHGRDWEFFADANVIVLSPCLDEAGREAALTELQAQWRRSVMRVVPITMAAVTTVCVTLGQLLPSVTLVS